MMKEDRRMKLQKKKFNSNHLLAIFIVVCGLLAGISVFAGGVLTPVKNIFFTVLSPMQEGINSVGNAVFSWNENAKSKKTLRAENERLQEKVDALKMQNRVLEQNQVELERLQDLLKLKQKYKKYHTVGARVISKGSGNWFDIFLIDKGSKDGIKKDMNVIAGNGLVGIVYDVSSHTAKVRTIINDTSMVSAMFLKTNDACIVNGSLDTMEDGYLEVVYISKDAKVKNGDELVTSYVSSKFNEGITIGKVSDLKLDSTKLTKTAKVTPIVDFKHLKEIPEDYWNQLTKSTPPHILKLMESVFSAFLHTINVPAEEINDLTDHITRRQFHMMFDSFEAYDVQETRRISREEGRIEGERVGRIEGERAGRIEGEQLYLIKQIIKRIIKNSPVSQIAADLMEPLDTIQPVYDLAIKQAPNFNAEKILNQLTSLNTSTVTK